MLLLISFGKHGIKDIDLKKGRIVLQVDDPAMSLLWLASVRGMTMEDFNKNKTLKGYHLFVSDEGTIRVKEYRGG